MKVHGQSALIAPSLTAATTRALLLPLLCAQSDLLQQSITVSIVNYGELGNPR